MPDADNLLLLYGILDAAARSGAAVASVLDRRSGVGDVSLELLEAEPFSVLAASISPDLVRRPDEATLLAYRDTIDAVHAAQTIVPLRFGTTMDARTEIQPLLAPNRDALRAHLERFEDRVEVGVRLQLADSPATDPAPDPAQAASGRAYLEARRDERAHRADREEAVVTAYRTAIEAAWVDGVRDRKETDDGSVLSAAFLVPRSRADAVCRRLEAVESKHVREAHVVGPWAPYSFVRL
jgi:hypothetical protein